MSAIEPYAFRNQRVVLRAFEPTDAGALQAYLNAPLLAGRRYIPDGFSDLAPLSSRQAEGVIEQWQKEKDAWTLAVLDAVSGALVGHVGANWEWDPHSPSTFVVISPKHTRRRFGSAAMGLALEFLFLETPAHAVSGWTTSWNEAGQQFMRSVGFREAGRRPRSGVHAGTFTQDVAFDLLRPEWIAQRSQHAA